MTGPATSEGQWIHRFHPSDESEFRIVCFPHAGGSASYYYGLSETLAPELDVLAVQYPGRQDRRAEGCVEDFTELADRSYAALRRAEDGRPCVFFGHSMGSILAFEVARRYQDDTGAPPAWLFASGYPAPSRLRGGTVHRRDDAGVVDELRAVGGTDPVYLENKHLAAAILFAVRGDYTAIENHPRTTGVRLDCPITMMVGDDDPHTTVAEAEAWGEHTAGAFALHVFRGGHFYLDTHHREVTGIISGTVREVSVSGV
ncbi:thioesterase II family protein [Yinghuangia seranimata]|uniref:thioesterase II family protein n=1 Tax=Yinghuangia seranimata TaxID=408067 RepID=UPI00248B4DC0|nr:alpha/beta fold hydrolase [Yinghuangia seranimata]MDI2127086.1 alpha/beta fold hydrolase [Yinghuangia seranimata]